MGAHSTGFDFSPTGPKGFLGASAPGNAEPPTGIAGYVNGKPVPIIQGGSGETEYRYRGVHADHPALEHAKQGRVVPGDVVGTVTPAQHNRGGSSAASPFTSWTGDMKLATGFATTNGPGGVILRVPVGSPPPGAAWSWEWSPDLYGENEFLMRGVRTGVEVLKP
jgi:hypothetical protein